MITGVKPIGGGSMKSRKLASKVTASYHSIKNELNMLEKSEKLTTAEKQSKVIELEGRLEDIGGIDAYQEPQSSPHNISRPRVGCSIR